MTDTIIILSKAETLKTIDRVAKRTGRDRDDIQAALIGGLAHAAEHGDFTLCTKLVKATSPQNGAQLRKFVVRFAPATWKDGEFRKAKKGGAFRVADAMGVLWYAELEAKKAETPKYDGAKVRKALAKKLAELEALALEAGDFGLLEIVQDAGFALESETGAAAKAA